MIPSFRDDVRACVLENAKKKEYDVLVWFFVEGLPPTPLGLSFVVVARRGTFEVERQRCSTGDPEYERLFGYV